MQKEFYFDIRPQSDIWDVMWTDRTIDDEVKACDLETPARDLFLAFIPKGGKVIDGGCGFAKWVIYLKKLGYDIVGIDNNEIAIAKLKEYDSSLPVELGDILDIHYPDSSFDAYISMGVVEHFEGGPLPALKEAHRVLKPDGLIFVSVPTVNILRNLVRRPLRIIINFVPRIFLELRGNWGKSRRSAILAPLGTVASIMPQSIVRMLVRVLLRQKDIYYKFLEYRYSKSEVQNFLKQSGFEVIKTVPHDFYGVRGHSVGLSETFPFLAARNAVNFKLNPMGTLISRVLNGISPRIACSSVLCVGRVLKKVHE
ncbi:MAG: class I SAM-dependent methyltransferase [Nitrososphaerota archaeon]|nr:class I SAM-dependent methyltransferase [Nitrososphaerota archaeon]